MSLEHPPRPASAETATVDLRQQSKIIKVIEGNNPDAISEPVVSISDEERESFLQKVADGSLDDAALDTKVIREIGSPFSGTGGVARLHQELQRNGSANKFLELTQEALYGPNRRTREDTPSTSEYTEEEIARFLAKYPTPHTFDEKLIGNRLQQLEATYEQENDLNRRSSLKMEISLQKQKEKEYGILKSQVYGKRNEYWEQVKLLKKDAREKFGVEEEIETPKAETEQPIEEISELKKPQQEETIPVQPQAPKPPVFEQLSPRSAELIRNQILERDLAYQDIDMPPDQKESYKQWVYSSESAKKYAESLVNASSTGGLETIRTQARELRDKMLTEASRTGIPMSTHGKSLSWAMWDMGKQYHFFTHQDLNDPTYEIGNPLESESKREEILNRHIGWEAYAAFQDKNNPEYKTRVQNDPRLRATLRFFTKEPNAHRSLSSNELAELGKMLRAE
jgi:hypothetical protein